MLELRGTWSELRSTWSVLDKQIFVCTYCARYIVMKHTISLMSIHEHQPKWAITYVCFLLGQAWHACLRYCHRQNMIIIAESDQQHMNVFLEVIWLPVRMSRWPWDLYTVSNHLRQRPTCYGTLYHTHTQTAIISSVTATNWCGLASSVVVLTCAWWFKQAKYLTWDA